MAGTEEAGTSFAERMMKNMGWSKGKGLGKEEAGMKDFIKPKMKFNTKGIGFMGVDNKWIAHQEHFDDLLTSLNKGEKPAEKKDIACLTSSSKLRGRTKFYAKMMRGKDLSNRSSHDLSSIIVPLSKKEKTEKPESSPLPSELGGTLKSSQVSMNDYFAKMMAQRKSKLNDGKGSNEDASQENSSDPGDRDEVPSTDAKKEKKQKKKKRSDVTEESGDTCEPETVMEESGATKKRKKRKTENADSIESSDSPGRARVAIDVIEINEDGDDSDPPKRKSKKTKAAPVIEIESGSDERAEKKIKKSKKRRSPEPEIEEAPQETHNEDTGVKRKKKKKSSCEESLEVTVGVEDHCEVAVEDESVQSRKTKSKKSKHKSVDGEFEINESGARLNIDVNLLKEIRGPELAKSKAAPGRDLTDEQIKEIHRLWTSGEYAEFMRRVHSGELPRWVAVDKSLVERMILGRTKLIDLADVREAVQTKWKGANIEEIWGYTNLAYLAV